MITFLNLLGIILMFNFPHIYGFAENRLFREHGDYVFCKHFKLYHLWLALIFLGSSFYIYALSNSIILTLAYFVYAPFGLDWVWWVIRYFDFQIDAGKAKQSYGEPNAWHLQSDWDNYLGLPLVNGTYMWWYVFGFTALALTILSLLF